MIGPIRIQSMARGESTIHRPFLVAYPLISKSLGIKRDAYTRHLAEVWDQTYLPPTHPLAVRRLSPNPTILNTIDTLVLLDLLGNSHSRIFSFFRETDWMHDLMYSVDKRLMEAGLITVESGEEGWFPSQKLGKGMIGDDHVPVCLLSLLDSDLAERSSCIEV